MSADGNLKFSLASFSANAHGRGTADGKFGRTQERTCAYCQLPLVGQPPVLLKSGHSVHLECYLQLPKHPNRRWRI